MAWSLFSQSQVSPKSWAEAVLSAGGWPKTEANIQSLIAWALNEGGGGQYNPLNTTLSEPGATSFNSVNVENYTSWHQGVTATVATLQSSDYTDVTSALKAGGGLGSGSYSGLSTWSGGGYANVSGTWKDAASYMGGKAVKLPGGGSSSSSSQSPNSGGLGGWVSSVWSGLKVGFDTSAQEPGSPAGGLSALANVSDTAQAIVGLTAPFVKVADAVDWFMQPSHWMRIFAGIGGTVLLGVGVWNISHVGGQAATTNVSVAGTGTTVPLSAGGTLALPIGILGIGLGAGLLFVAFHNLPPTVRTLPDFLSYLQQEVHKTPSKAPAPETAAA